MDEPPPTPPLKKPRRRFYVWFRRFLLFIGICFLLITLFHRTIFFGLVKWGVGFAEKSAHMQISYQLEGTIFTSLILTDLQVRTLEPGPLAKLKLSRLALRYHPWDGLTQGLPALIDAIEVRDLDLVLDGTFPSKSKPKPVAKKSGGIVIPFPKLVDIRGINVTIKTAAEPLEIKNANLTLLPGGPGVLSLERLAIPAYRTFINLHGETSYADRNLILKNLAIEKNLVIEKLQIDASKISEDQLAAQIVAQTFGGTLNLDFSIAHLSENGEFVVNLASQKIDLTQALAFAAPVAATPPPLPPMAGNSAIATAPSPQKQLAPELDSSPAKGTLEHLNLRLAGVTTDLATWNGYVQLDAVQLLIGKSALDRATLQVTITNGQVKIIDTIFAKGEEKVTLAGTAQLPGKDPGKIPFLANLNLTADLPDISTFLPNASGNANFQATIAASPTKIDARLGGKIDSLSLANLSIASAQIDTKFTKTDDQSIDWKKPWWNNTNLTVAIDLANLTISGYKIDRINAGIHSTNENLAIDRVEIARGSNTIRSTGRFVFQEKPASRLPGALSLALTINTPVLKEFSLDPGAPVIEGKAEGTANVDWAEKNPTADLQLVASDLLHQGVKLGTVTLKAHAENGLAVLKNLMLDLPDGSFFQASGEYDLEKSARYSGQISTRVNDLSQFKPLLGPSAAKTALAGSLNLDWNGSGRLTERLHEGQLTVDIENAIYAELTSINLQAAGFYNPKNIEFPSLVFASNKGNLTTALRYAERVLHLTDLKLSQGNDVRLAGNISLPLDLEQLANSEKRFPLDAPLQINLAGKDVKVGDVLTSLGMVPPATGIVALAINAKGTLRNLDASIQLKVDQLKVEKAKQLQPITTEINLAIANQRASLSGTIQEPSLQPIALSGNLPLELASIISTGSISPDLPISAKVSLPPTDLSFVSRYVSSMESIQGQAGLDVQMEGTLRKPRLFGNVKTNLSSLHFRGESVPDIRNMNVELAFRENVLTIDQFKADLAGGPIAATGKIDFTKPADPIFDISLNGKSILVTRNDNMIVRADLALALKGPLATAELTGDIGVTDSRFFRDIDILPLNLPGRPAPAIQDKRSAISITAPPVRDWKFNVNIKTADPFQITGNLANGNVIMDLNLNGTGLAPTLDGYVRVSQLEASLPFSNLTITDGNIYFSKDLPLLNPVLDLTGKSQVRDYDITAYIYGDLVKPQTLFLSQPPLSQEDILTLLATGVTRSEIQQNPQLLAGRAGYLFIQKYYNKVFKKKSGTKDENSFVDRFDLQIGNVDPKTGRENVSARFKLTDKFRIIFDLDLTGGLRGQVRYLIRFK